jgi:two-component system, NarL family, sensor kinase
MTAITPKALTPHASLGAQLRHDAAVRCQERGRIARELHDSTSQLLIALQLNLACLKASSENADTHQLFCSLDDTLRELHFAVRAVSSSDATPSLTDDLPAALRAMAMRFALFAKIEVTQDVRGNCVSWPKDAEMSLYRIAQEALANTARHAHAKKVKLQLDYRRNGTLKLTIEDDGVGFGFSQEAGLPEVGTGIRNIRERVRDMGGHLSLKRLPAGSRVAVSIHS